MGIGLFSSGVQKRHRPYVFYRFDRYDLMSCRVIPISIIQYHRIIVHASARARTQTHTTYLVQRHLTLAAQHSLDRRIGYVL
jgi:hypothetical protein